MSPLGAPKSSVSDGPANVNLPTTAETVVCTTNAIDVTQEGDQVIIEGFAQIATGAAATGVIIRVRRGGLTGPQVGQAGQQASGAGVGVQLGTQVDDIPPESAGLVYVLTIQQQAATGNGTCTWSNVQLTY